MSCLRRRTYPRVPVGVSHDDDEPAARVGRDERGWIEAGRVEAHGGDVRSCLREHRREIVRGCPGCDRRRRTELDDDKGP